MSEKDLTKKTTQQVPPSGTAKNIPAVRIISSMPLDLDAKKKIEVFIAKKHANNQKLAFEYEVDSSILGGLLIVDGDKYYDGTLRSQLIVIRKQLAKD